MTSLQKAAAASQTPKSSFLTSKGQFESCFASGLDLTEFGQTSTGSDGPVESAAAQLLRVREEERRRREEEETVEQRIKEVMRERVADIQESLKKTRESNVLVNALVQMHGSDTSDPSVYRKNKKLAKKLGIEKRHLSSTSASGGKVHKKSRRNKY